MEAATSTGGYNLDEQWHAKLESVLPPKDMVARHIRRGGSGVDKGGLESPYSVGSPLIEKKRREKKRERMKK